MEDKEKKPVIFSAMNVLAKKNNTPKVKSASKGRVVDKSTEGMKTLPLDAYRADIGRGVNVVLIKDKEEDYSKLKTLEDILEFDKRKPNNIIGFEPAIYYEFIDKRKGKLNFYVKVGDVVKVKEKFKPKNAPPRRTVVDLYLSSLKDMTVIVAKLDDNSVELANRLELYEY